MRLAAFANASTTFEKDDVFWREEFRSSLFRMLVLLQFVPASSGCIGLVPIDRVDGLPCWIRSEEKFDVFIYTKRTKALTPLC